MGRVRGVSQEDTHGSCVALEVTASQKATLQGSLRSRMFLREGAGLLSPAVSVRYGRGPSGFGLTPGDLLFAGAEGTLNCPLLEV